MKYYKFSPGQGAQFWQQMRDQGIASIGWGNYDYASKENREEIRALRPKYFDEHRSSPAIINRFNEINIGDVIYAFRGVNTIIARGVVKSPSQYSEQLILDRNGEGHHTFIEVEWVEFENEITIERQVSRNTISDVTERQEEFENMISGNS